MNDGEISFTFLRDQVIKKGVCTGCGACLNLCPYLSLYEGAIISPDACALEEGRCVNFCPRGPDDGSDPLLGQLWRETDPENPIGPVNTLTMAQTADPVPSAQYGGVVTAIIQTAISEAEYDGALVTTWQNADYPRGRVIKTPEEVFASAGVHYATGYSLSALNAYRKTNPKPLVIVGLPCQIFAVRRMQATDHPRNPHKGMQDLLIGLFCTWALSPRPFFAEMRRRFGEQPVRKYDIPPPPANRLDIIFEDGTRADIPLDEIRPFINPGCRTCPDMTAEFADISVGAAEGFSGWNTLIVRTGKGTTLFNHLSQAGILKTRDMPEASRSHLAEASLLKRKRAFQALQPPLSEPMEDPQ